MRKNSPTIITLIISFVLLLFLSFYVGFIKKDNDIVSPISTPIAIQIPPVIDTITPLPTAVIELTNTPTAVIISTITSTPTRAKLSTPTPASTSTPTPVIHTIIKDENLWWIAQDYYGEEHGIKAYDICNANTYIKNCNLIFPNNLLIIP